MIGGVEVARAGVVVCGAGVSCGGHTGRTGEGVWVVLLVDDQGGQGAVENSSTGHYDQQVFFRLRPVKVHFQSPGWASVKADGDSK
jgi:hypothetical protein